MQIEIQDNLYKRLEKFQSETSFKDINKLIGFIIEDYLAANSSAAEKDAGPAGNDDINQRLKDLGYF